ncbi:MAG: citramalate synthase [Oscillospiraceae bacterium]|jgi:2-isopropylmalate synthase|nr:citramalate synthase [Oscillospiraceae bacterium]
MRKLEIFDSTLRDGAQGEGISFSLEDKLKILAALDSFGIDFVEAGNPGSNPKDLEFFKQAGKLGLKTKLVSFGSTKRKEIPPEEDGNLKALLTANTEYIAIFGKSWDLHVDKILRVSHAENLDMIEQTIKYLTDSGKKVIFDAEHFFDGYKHNPDYAAETLKAAERAGAVTLCLCDTNGGRFPDEIDKIIHSVNSQVNTPLGIHCHNDNGCGVANSMAAVSAGAVQVQGTFIGIGERTGNANLAVLIANLQLKLGYSCVPAESLPLLKETAHFIAETANIALPNSMPYVGSSAFAHKGGMHVDGVLKDPATFEHITPASVGNERNFLLSEVSGRAVTFAKLEKIIPGLQKTDPLVQTLTTKIKELEHQGYQFEAADASFELLVQKELGQFQPYFEIIDFKIISSHYSHLLNRASALIKVRVGGEHEITADEGDGPVNAIDKALRKALERFYPALSNMRLADFKVRIVGGSEFDADVGRNTAATTRVLIESTDGKTSWTTVGASKDIINASMTALLDSLEYMLYNNREQNFNYSKSC